MLRTSLHLSFIVTTLLSTAAFGALAKDSDAPVAEKPAQAASAPDTQDNNSGGDAQPAAKAKAPNKQANAKQGQNTQKNAAAAAPAAAPQTGNDGKQSSSATSPASTTAEPSATPDTGGQKVSTDALEPKKEVAWPFNGMTGHVDKQAAQRGFQIYSQVCSACHSMNLVAYRSLQKLGFSEAEVKAIASQKQVADEDDSGQTVQRPGKPSDHFAPPFPNERAAAAANGGAAPPDLSLIIKAREQGPDYVYSILTGFGNPPANEPVVANKYYNPYFQGHWISMPPPLHDGAVTYQDGTSASVDQMARDVVTFLQWAAEPEMEQRHEMGLKALAFLFIMTVALYIAKKRVWKNIRH